MLELLQFVRGYDREKAGSRPELVIDGRTLGFVLGNFYPSVCIYDILSSCGRCEACVAWLPCFDTLQPVARLIEFAGLP